MKVGFFYQDGQNSDGLLDIASNLLDSVSKVMPGVEVHQLTDGESRILDGVDGFHRLRGTFPMGVRRMSHYAELDGDWMFVDTDVVVRRDVRDVFDSAFDVALTDRVGTYMEGTPYANVMPYNFGVIFSRSKAFWATAREYLLMLPPKYQEWEGEQRVIAHMMTLGLGFNVKVLPGLKYNFPPLSGAESLEHASIVHFKGNAKRFIKEAA